VIIQWLRGNDSLSLDRPHTYYVLGIRGSGKSSLLEHIGEGHLQKGHAILDLFGSRDGEGLAWLRSPWIKDKRILLYHGNNADVDCFFETRKVADARLSDLDRYDLLISASPLYASPNDEFGQVSRLTDLLYKRLSWRRLVYVIVREAANLYYSRLKVVEDQTQAKAEMVYLIREARHMGVAMGLDTLKYTSVDSDIRNVIDYIFFKSLGMHGLPRSLWWVYSYFDPNAMQKMKPDEFVVLSRRGCLGLGKFPEIPWHKREREHILQQLGIVVEFGEEPDYGKDKGTYTTVSDREHAAIIAKRAGGLSMAKLAEEFHRSSGAIMNQINRHNRSIARVGVCEKCHRVDGEFAKMKI